MSNLLRRYISAVLNESSGAGPKRLRVFDFDDTLVKTRSLVHVTTQDGRRFDLTPGEYAVYVPLEGDSFDYSDFDKLIDPREVRWTMKLLRLIVDKGGEVVVLSARSNPGPIRQFLRDAGLPDLEVVALGDSDPSLKAAYVDRRLRGGVTHVEFFDDSYKNIEAVRALEAHHPGASIVVRHVVHRSGIS